MDHATDGQGCNNIPALGSRDISPRRLRSEPFGVRDKMIFVPSSAELDCKSLMKWSSLYAMKKRRQNGLRDG